MKPSATREQGALTRREALTLVAHAATGLALLAGGGLAHASAPPITPAPWPSRDGWERRTVAHFLNAVYPGDDGVPLFDGDRAPLKSGGDATAGAWAAGALEAFYDPFYGAAGQLGLLATALDWDVRTHGGPFFFHEASQEQQLAALDRLAASPVGGAAVDDAVMLALAAVLGAFYDARAVRDLGWPGPNGGYWSDARAPADAWQRPARLTADGNLP